jgi:phage terminase small subunit
MVPDAGDDEARMQDDEPGDADAGDADVGHADVVHSDVVHSGGGGSGGEVGAGRTRGLTPRQERFITEYLIDLNATQAALRAGYKPSCARWYGARILGLPGAREAIERGQAVLLGRAQVRQEQVISELKRMAFYDVGVIAGHRLDGPEDIATLPAEVRGAIAGWSWDRAGNFTVRLTPRTPSLELLARHLGLVKDVRQHLGRDGKPVDPPALYTVIVK